MSESSKPGDQRLERPELNGQPMPIEEHLLGFRPRAPRLNWDEVASATSAQATTPLSESVAAVIAPQVPTEQRTGFTTKQMTLAIAASWILGAAIGGGSIFWSMSSRDASNANPTTTVSRSKSDEAPAAPSQPVPSATKLAGEPAREPAREPTSHHLSASSRAAFDPIGMTWRSDEPLTARSLTSLPGRLTALRSTNASEHIAPDSTAQSPDANRNASPSSAVDSSSINQPPITHRQQMLRQLLQDSGKSIY